ncbi:MAG TPA: hypothetical protein VOA80_07820 [Thermoanaerobaculia bacterium]|nr:hypothetical protein [Thermoanaerobaculia bacterium]
MNSLIGRTGMNRIRWQGRRPGKRDKLPAMRHVIATRFSVPRLDPATAPLHADRRWLESRLAPFRTYYVPSVQRLRVPVVLLCSSQSAEYVSGRLADLKWLSIVVQDGWYGGWRGSPEQVVTRLDSDDALHEDWFRRLDDVADAAAAAGAEVLCTKDFLRLDARTGRVHGFRRREPSPLAAFLRGANPFAHDHKVLERHYRTQCLPGPYLLQVVHGGNLANRPPAWWRFHRRVPPARLAVFGVAPPAGARTPFAAKA